MRDKQFKNTTTRHNDVARKVAIVVFYVVVIYMAPWAPILIISCIMTRYISHALIILHIIFHILLYVHGVINPILYFVQLEGVKAEMIAVLTCK